uniref:Uncharacterized protein n=1 Tax=Leersia perrieri TaxID=77586 RepID=A0A0D9VUW2_9ORYZ
MSASSSAGWTDEKHMLYISSLEESFVTQLYGGEVNSKGVWQSSSVWGHGIYKGNRTDTIVAQGYWEIGEVGGAASRASQADRAESTLCYGHQEECKSYFMGDDAPTTEPGQDRISYRAKQNNHGVSSWITELSDQNFINEAGIRTEDSVAYSNKRLKHAAAADGTSSSLVASPGNANLVGYCSVSSSDLDIELLNAEIASPSWKAQGQRTWSV